MFMSIGPGGPCSPEVGREQAEVDGYLEAKASAGSSTNPGLQRAGQTRTGPWSRQPRRRSKLCRPKSCTRGPMSNGSADAGRVS
jgi:hypothetical protein